MATNAANGGMRRLSYIGPVTVIISLGGPPEQMAGDGGMIESEEDGAEGYGLFVRVRLELRMNVDDEGGVDGGK